MFGFVYVSFLCVVTVVLIYSNNCAIWILLTNNNCEGLFGSFTPSVKAKVKVVAASYCGTGTGGTTVTNGNRGYIFIYLYMWYVPDTFVM